MYTAEASTLLQCGRIQKRVQSIKRICRMVVPVSIVAQQSMTLQQWRLAYMPKKKNSPAYGKGSWKRPVNEKKYSVNWDRIFGNKESKDQPK